MSARLRTIVLCLLVASPAAAGGLIGESGLQKGELGVIINRKIAPPTAPAPTRAPRSFEQTLQDKSLNAPDSLGNLQPYLELLESKTQEQTTYEKRTKSLLGMDVSNICLTAVGACVVDYAVSGSSCFCESKSGIELGIVK